ncbi:MAG: 1-acyl-sn-glycerol-3-phosphate acyltransferase [Bacteroidales bacterium]
MGISILYKLLFRWVQFLHSLYYRKIEIDGLENIPEGRIIFSPNHQNAIMDALAVLCTVKKPIFFLARGDFFINRWVASFFHFLKIFPAYRKVEGYQQLTQNYTTLAMARRWLLSGSPVCIFPEGGHEGSWRVRTLSKGIFRLALQAQADIPREPVYIVPVGIYYSSYTAWGATLHVKFGKAIPVTMFLKTWKMNKAQGINQLKKTVYNAMQQTVLHVHNAFYPFIVHATPYVSAYFNRTGQYDFVRTFVNYCNALCVDNPALMQQASQKFELCYQKSRSLQITPHCVAKTLSGKNFIFHSFGRMVVLPFALILVIYLFPLLALVKFINRYISDKQFHSSVRFVILFLLPLWCVVMSIVIWPLAKNIFVTPVVLVVLTLFAGKGYRAIEVFSHWYDEWKCFRNRQYIQQIRQEIKEIVHLLNFSYPYVATNQSRENIVSRY